MADIWRRMRTGGAAVMIGILGLVALTGCSTSDETTSPEASGQTETSSSAPSSAQGSSEPPTVDGFTYPEGWDVPHVEGINFTLDDIESIKRAPDGRLMVAWLRSTTDEATEEIITNWLDAVQKQTGEPLKHPSNSQRAVGSASVQVSDGVVLFQYGHPVSKSSQPDEITLPESWTKTLPIPEGIHIHEAYQEQSGPIVSWKIISLDEKDMYVLADWMKGLVKDGWHDRDSGASNEKYSVRYEMNTDITPYQTELTIVQVESATSTI